MKIQKLNWAGIKLEVANKTILIDAVDDFSVYNSIIGEPKKKIFLFADHIKADYILFTHLHLDHFDVGLIKKCLKPEGKLLVYSPLVERVRKHFGNITIVDLDLDQVFIDSDLKIKPVFAMDGIGEVQSSWIIESGGTKIFHGGDTIWHNQFWRLGKENQNIDYAFLPVNGAIVNFPMIGLEYSPIPAILTLEQAFVAAHLLHAKQLIPIHYGLLEHEQFYIPQKFTDEDLISLSNKIQQPFTILNDGENLY
jgi:L-ascorbate metabolism protein UlaG (beta-lactamase superfamily)